MATHESYRIKEGMKAYLCLPKNIAGELYPGEEISWMYAGNIERPGSIDLGRAVVIATVVEKKWAGLGYRRVIFELSNIRDFKNTDELVHEAIEAIKRNPSTASIPGMRICKHNDEPIFAFNPGVISWGGKEIPCPFEESLYKVSWI